MTTLPELRSRLKALVTMHADTLDPQEQHAWMEERQKLRELSEMLLERLNRRVNRNNMRNESRLTR